MGVVSLSYIFTVPPTGTPDDPASLLEFLAEFDFGKDAPKILAKNAVLQESAVEVMTPSAASNPKREAFKAGGGKMIIYRGQSDAVFSTNDLVDCYEKRNSLYWQPKNSSWVFLKDLVFLDGAHFHSLN